MSHWLPEAEREVENQQFRTAATTAVIGVTDSDNTFCINATAVFTLPPVTTAIKGTRYMFLATAASLSLTITPNAVDNIYGSSVTATDGQSLVCSSTVAGACAEIVCDGVNWVVIRLIGTWTKA